MATEEEVVLGSDRHGISREDGGVDGEGNSHATGDAVNTGKSVACDLFAGLSRIKRP